MQYLTTENIPNISLRVLSFKVHRLVSSSAAIIDLIRFLAQNIATYFHHVTISNIVIFCDTAAAHEYAQFQ